MAGSTPMCSGYDPPGGWDGLLLRGYRKGYRRYAPSVTTAVTTIKVPVELRERIAHEASDLGLTAAGFLARLLAEHDRERRVAAVRAAYASPADAAYDEETRAWETTLADGLDGS
jgi:hypothetical protein